MRRVFFDPIYNKKIFVYYGVPYSSYRRSIRRMSEDDPGDIDGQVCGVYCPFTEAKTGRRRYSIWVDKPPRRVREVGTLCHEVFHLTVDILRQTGVRWGNGASEEAFVYLFEGLLDKILEKMGVE